MKKLAITTILLFSIIVINAQNDRADLLQNLEKAKPSSQEASLTATLKSASRLFGEKNDLTTVITIIPSGTTVKVIGFDSTYFHVVYNEDEGYILRRQATLNSVQDNQDMQSQAEVVGQKPQAKEESQQPQQVSRFTYLEGKYGTSTASKMMSGKIWKGMSAEMVRDSWGKPQKINRVISGNTIKEEWIYKNTWLFIQDDVLNEWGPIR